MRPSDVKWGMKKTGIFLLLCASGAMCFGAAHEGKHKKPRRTAATQKAGHARKALTSRAAKSEAVPMVQEPEIPAEELPVPEPTPPLP